jgi:hypothetical protein
MWLFKGFEFTMCLLLFWLLLHVVTTNVPATLGFSEC